MTFIDTINDKTNTDIVDSDAKGDQEARDDLRVGLGSVQKRDHVEAGIAGSGEKPPTSAPRDTPLQHCPYPPVAFRGGWTVTHHHPGVPKQPLCCSERE